MRKYSYHLVGLLLFIVVTLLGVSLLGGSVLLTMPEWGWAVLFGGVFLLGFGLVRLVSARQPEGFFARDWPLVLTFAVCAGFLCWMAAYLIDPETEDIIFIPWGVGLCTLLYLVFYAGFKGGQKRYYQALALPLAFALPFIAMECASLLYSIFGPDSVIPLAGWGFAVAGLLGYALGRFARLPESFAPRWWPWLFPPLFWLLCGGAFTLYSGKLWVDVMALALSFIVPPYLACYLGFGLGSFRKQCAGKLRGAGIYVLALALCLGFFLFAFSSTANNPAYFFDSQALEKPLENPLEKPVRGDNQNALRLKMP